MSCGTHLGEITQHPVSALGFVFFKSIQSVALDVHPEIHSTGALSEN